MYMESGKLKASLIAGRALVQRLLRPLGLRPSRKVGGHRLVFDPATDIGLDLLLTGRFEREAIAQCAKFIRPDGVVIDVGANIGVHAVHFADLASSGKVVCFEPARATFGLLLRNVSGLANVVPLNLALSDTSGLQTFFIAADNAYSGLKDTKRKALLRHEQVACFTGDEILPSLVGSARVDLIKIDVEGLETHVLTGLRQFLTAHRPVIFCEIFAGHDSNPDPRRTVQFCTSLGYDAFVLNGSQLAPAAEHDDSLYNYFFIPRASAGLEVPDI
jgi:FkbM family methyltransferase